jgi:hypothetical protein
MLVHKKVTKEHDTPYRLFLALLALMGGKRKLAKKQAQTATCQKPPLILRYSAR